MDRQNTTPFHLKLFYRLHAFHALSDFPIPSSPTDTPAFPPHLQIYTWPSCTLRELAQLLTSCLPSLLPEPAVGTRLSFRLVYPDTKGAAIAAATSSSGAGGGGGGLDAGHGPGQGRFLSKDMGSVVIGVDRRADDKKHADEEVKENGEKQPGKSSGGAATTTTTTNTTTIGRSSSSSFRLHGDDADKTLQDLRFVIGDYVDCAILPPLSDGSVAPPLTGRSGAMGGGMRAFGNGPYARDRDRLRSGAAGGGAGRSGGGGPMITREIPPGGWKRGERLPDTGGRGSSRSIARNRGKPY
ncbi:hypothetical protein VTO42DRAFT_1773 [Malbranchea cinnamomea]